MATFVDRKGRAWRVELTIGAMRRVRSLLGVELLDSLSRLDEDVALRVDTLYVLCMDQTREARVSDRKFGRSLKGRIDDASTALAQALDDFLPAPDPNAPKERKTDTLSEMCWTAVNQCAGIVGVDPDPYTLRDLFAMADARIRLLKALHGITRTGRKMQRMRVSDLARMVKAGAFHD